MIARAACVPIAKWFPFASICAWAKNVTLAPLPNFDGPVQFYPRLPIMVPRIVRFVRHVDLVHCRVPTPAAVVASICARLFGRPQFLLVVGDLRALLPTMPYRGLKRLLWRAYTAFEEFNVQWMADHALTFANGEALTRAFGRLRKDAAVGVDGITVEQYGQALEENLRDLHRRMKASLRESDRSAKRTACIA